MTRHRDTYVPTKNPHGLYTFCCGVVVGLLIAAGAALLAAVNL